MIPEATIRRLSIYHRCLRRVFSKGKGDEIVSSSTIARRCGTSPSQLRKDLSYFGGFGIKGKGYRVKELVLAIERILGIDKKITVILVGVGSLGRAVLRYLQGVPYFEVLGAFDRDEGKWGKKIGNVEVAPSDSLPEFLKENRVELGVISTSPEGVQEVVDTLWEGGVKGVLSFALAEVEVPRDMVLEFVDIAAELEFLYYKANKLKKIKGGYHG